MRPGPRPQSHRCRFHGVTLAALSLGSAFLLLDLFTLFRTVSTSTASGWAGGFDVAITGGCVWIRTGDGFERKGEVYWQTPDPRIWLPRSNWYSISGALNWRETYVPLWLVWGPAIGVVVAAGPIRRLRRARRGECIRCGYSRAGLQTDAACPECGQRP